MKEFILVSCFSLFVLTACSLPVVEDTADGGPPASATPQEVSELWMPKAVENCLASVRGGVRVEPARIYNPFYLRLDVDGDDKVDHAVLVRTGDGESAASNGLVVCRTGAEVSTFGAGFGGEVTLGGFEDGNFVTGDWEVVPKSLAADYIRDAKGVGLIGGKSYGDVIGFFHEGGAVYIFWTGTAFKVVEGV
jgi:hypothetical protein